MQPLGGPFYCIHSIPLLYVVYSSCSSRSNVSETGGSYFIDKERKAIRNLPRYFKGVLGKLVDETYFEDMFMLFDVPVEVFYWPE